MKKFLALALSGVMVLSLVACGQKADQPAVDPGDSPQGEVAVEDVNTTGPVSEDPAIIEETPDVEREPDVTMEFVGGWSNASARTANEEDVIRFSTAMGEYLKTDMTGFALKSLLGTQVVAGTNYCYLASETVKNGDVETTRDILVYIYEDLNGKSSVTNVYTLQDGDDVNDFVNFAHQQNDAETDVQANTPVADAVEENAENASVDASAAAEVSTAPAAVVAGE